LTFCKADLVVRAQADAETVENRKELENGKHQERGKQKQIAQPSLPDPAEAIGGKKP
jgi:hypothetical protein